MLPIQHVIRRALALCFLAGSLAAQLTPVDIAYQLATRYTPYADGSGVLDPEKVARGSTEAWWFTPGTLRTNRPEGASALAGLHIALDPGHIGGLWATWEGRHFRMADQDHWVREGELVLEVAQRVRARLIALGAEVTVLRESAHPVNPKRPADYWACAAAGLQAPDTQSLAAQIEHALTVRNRAVKMAIVSGELVERARLVNEIIRPDALISLHINAAPWPEGGRRQLVDSDHAHVLVFGCLSADELASSPQQAQLIKKLSNGSGPIEAVLGAALGQALIEATGLPASDYEGGNAIRIDPRVPSLWARNLMLLRLVDCPVVLLEPYIANSHNTYARLQQALSARASQWPLPEDDILIEYAEAVVDGILRVYACKDTAPAAY